MQNHVFVVGNGHLKLDDSVFLKSLTTSSTIIRFNDMNTFDCNDPITIHVSRIPSSWPSFCKYDAIEWYVTPYSSENTPPGANLTIEVYEADTSNNDVPSSLRLFSKCSSCHDECYHNASAWGPSTGSAVIDYLEYLTTVDRIDVFGMNWRGNSKHIDFMDPTIVKRCCTKCVFHDTLDDTYGDEYGMNSIFKWTGISTTLFVLLLRIVYHFFCDKKAT